jgi:uncharacterized membrane protein
VRSASASRSPRGDGVLDRAHAGFVSIVLVASAVFPSIAVALSIGYLGERPVPNQYVGVGLTVLGLLVLGLGA